MASASWKNITAENLEFARSVTRDLVSIVAIGQQEQLGEIKQGYGNYGTWGFCSLYSRSIWLTTDVRGLLDQDVIEEEDGVVVKGKAESLFLGNYPKLQELKKKYDPENIFNKWFAITPAL